MTEPTPNDLLAAIEALNQRLDHAEGKLQAVGDRLAYRAFLGPEAGELVGADPALLAALRRWEEAIGQAMIAFMAGRARD